MKFKKLNLDFFKVFKKPFFIGSMIAILLSIVPITYMILELNNQKIVSLVANFLNTNSEVRWKGFKTFTWSLIPVPSLKWQQIELEEKNRKETINIQELYMSLSTSQLLNGVISVKKMYIKGIDITANEEINHFSEFATKIFNLGREIQSRKSTSNYRYKDLSLFESFIFNPYAIEVTDANFKQNTRLAKKIYNFHGASITLTKRINDKSIFQLASIDLKSNLVINNLETTLNGKFISSIDHTNDTVYLNDMDFSFTLLGEEKANISLSGDLEYSYKNNFVQSNVKCTTKNIQSLATTIGINLPKKINNADFNHLSIASTIIYEGDVVKIKNIILETPEFDIQGSLNYNTANKGIFASLKGSGVIFDDAYEEYTFAKKNNTKASKHKSEIFTAIDNINILKFLSQDNMHIIYTPKYFQWKNIRFNYPSIEFKRRGDNYSLHYESDINSGKIILSSTFKHRNSSIISKADCVIVDLDMGATCSHIPACTGLKGEMNFTSNFNIDINNERLLTSGVIESNTENMVISGIDIDYAYQKFINALINKDVEYTKVVAKTHFNSMKAKITIENRRVKFFKIEAYTTNNKILGSGVFNIQTNIGRINLKISPKNYDLFYNNEYPGEFHDMVLPIVLIFKDDGWSCHIDKNNFESYLQKKNFQKSKIDEILHKSLLY